jgi:imidazolonepropionase
MRTNLRLLLTNIGQLLTLRSPNPKSTGPRRGPELNDIGLIEDAAVLCAEGKIAAAGKRREVARHPMLKSKGKGAAREYDCGGGVVLPGFVDAHTHPAFMTPRLVDFEQRGSGASYQQIAEKGGGIRSSVESVRKAAVKALAERVLKGLEQMGAQGTTTVEAKSGYGLSTDAELKSLEAIAQAAKRWPGTVVPTLLGAHVVPKEFLGKPQQYVREVVKRMIPQASRRKLAAFVDVFVDRGAFSLADAEQIFEAAAEHGLGVRVHICQFTSNSVWPLLRFHPASLDHMDNVIDDDLPQLERHGTVVTLVPASNHFLGLGTYPPARRMIDAGVAVALATDYNPGTAPTPSLPFVMSLACTQMRMTPAEAIAAATINGAHALRLAVRKGSVEPGKDADLALFDVTDYREIPYWMAANLCRATVFGGRLQV